MAKAYIMLGRIASGKSYVAKNISQKSGAVILSCDEIIWSLFDSCLGENLVPTEKRALEYLLGMAKQLARNDCDVIFDCVLFDPLTREYVRKQLSLMGYEVERILVSCSDDIRHKRLNQRNLQRAGQKNKAYVLPWEKVLQIEDARYKAPRQDEFDTLIENN